MSAAAEDDRVKRSEDNVSCGRDAGSETPLFPTRIRCNTGASNFWFTDVLFTWNYGLTACTRLLRLELP